ncbi:MAG: hypothetical protein ACREN8_08905, partial [Candidatus Dormibacteraceae bacterium]
MGRGKGVITLDLYKVSPLRYMALLVLGLLLLGMFFLVGPGLAPAQAAPGRVTGVDSNSRNLSQSEIDTFHPNFLVRRLDLMSGGRDDPDVKLAIQNHLRLLLTWCTTRGSQDGQAEAEKAYTALQGLGGAQNTVVIFLESGGTDCPPTPDTSEFYQGWYNSLASKPNNVAPGFYNEVSTGDPNTPFYTAYCEVVKSERIPGNARLFDMIGNKAPDTCNAALVATEDPSPLRIANVDPTQKNVSALARQVTLSDDSILWNSTPQAANLPVNPAAAPSTIQLNPPSTSGNVGQTPGSSDTTTNNGDTTIPNNGSTNTGQKHRGQKNGGTSTDQNNNSGTNDTTNANDQQKNTNQYQNASGATLSCTDQSELSAIKCTDSNSRMLSCTADRSTIGSIDTSLIGGDLTFTNKKAGKTLYCAKLDSNGQGGIVGINGQNQARYTNPTTGDSIQSCTSAQSLGGSIQTMSNLNLQECTTSQGQRYSCTTDSSAPHSDPRQVFQAAGGKIAICYSSAGNQATSPDGGALTYTNPQSGSSVTCKSSSIIQFSQQSYFNCTDINNQSEVLCTNQPRAQYQPTQVFLNRNREGLICYSKPTTCSTDTCPSGGPTMHTEPPPVEAEPPHPPEPLHPPTSEPVSPSAPSTAPSGTAPIVPPVIV